LKAPIIKKQPRKEKKISWNKKRKKVRTHSIFKFNKMTFVWQNLDGSDVSAADIVEFPTKNWNDSK